LERQEQRYNELHEAFKTLEQKYTKSDAENQALKTWTTNQLLRVWAGVNQQAERTTASMDRIVQTIREDSFRHMRMKELMEITFTVKAPENIDQNTTVSAPAGATSRIAPPASPPHQKWVEVPEDDDETGQPPASLGSAAPSSMDNMDEAEDGELRGDDIEKEVTPPADARATRQSSRPPSRQGSVAPQPVRAPRVGKRGLSVVPEGNEESHAAKKQKNT
jgi:hypothetical protein